MLNVLSAMTDCLWHCFHHATRINESDQSTERAAWHDFARAPRDATGVHGQLKAAEWRRRFSRGRDRAEHHVLCGGNAGYGKALSVARSTAPAVAGLYDADKLFVYVPQKCRPSRQRSTPVRNNGNKSLVSGPRQARRSEVRGKVTRLVTQLGKLQLGCGASDPTALVMP
jgi:hypothetical protein